MSVAQNIVEIVRQHVPPEQAPEVMAVRVRVGSLSGIVPDSLEFCFGALVADTDLRRARLEIEHVPTECECRDCGGRFEPEALIFFCPVCGGGRARLISGADLQVVHVELDDVPPPGPKASNQRRERSRAAAGGGGGAPPQGE
jgi:hydrogenase nickel incorporation protein HypA/HybF